MCNLQTRIYNLRTKIDILPFVFDDVTTGGNDVITLKLKVNLIPIVINSSFWEIYLLLKKERNWCFELEKNIFYCEQISFSPNIYLTIRLFFIIIIFLYIFYIIVYFQNIAFSKLRHFSLIPKKINYPLSLMTSQQVAMTSLHPN